MGKSIIHRLLPQSLITQLRLALLLLFFASAGSVGFTIYELDLRKHDYVILSLAGQLRALSQNMVQQSLHYSGAMFPDGSMDEQQSQVFVENIRQQRDQFERIVNSLANRLLEPELTGRSDPLQCSWDERSIAQLNLTQKTWQEFRLGLDEALLLGETNAAARYILKQEAHLTAVAKNLSGAFQEMMEGKMKLIALFNQIALVSFFIIAAILLALFTYTFSRPLRTTLSGISRVSQGDFGYQLPTPGHNEIGEISNAFNGLSCRLHALFRLNDQINRASSIDESLEYVFTEFRPLLPLEWVGMLTLEETSEMFVLEHRYNEEETALEEGERFIASGSLLGKSLSESKPLYIDDLAKTSELNPNAEFARRLSEDGYRSALFFPVGEKGKWSAILAFAAKTQGAYNRDHLELLRNIASQVSRSLEKTVVTESLVVSAITGLASLAESRDPETGDHLLRMARYSALIAEELSKDGPYCEQVDNHTVRDILRFAPMHDIGKVGIEDRILLKPGKLDEAERRKMEQHPLIGAEVLHRCELQMNAVGHTVFQIGIEIAEGHHEHFNGKGYPHGLKGQAIPLSARIVAAADVFDALTSKRPYKKAWSVDDAVALMRQESGEHFDPVVVNAMEKALPRMMRIYEKYKHVE